MVVGHYWNFKELNETSVSGILCDHARILVTTLLYKPLILQREIWYWSLLGLKGIKKNHTFCNLRARCINHEGCKSREDKQTSASTYLAVGSYCEGANGVNS